MISQKRIRSLALHLPGVPSGKPVVPSVRNIDRFTTQLARAGFAPPTQLGDRVLPAILGPVTRRNAEGWFVRHTDQPKETAYREVEWRWLEYHGSQRIERSGFRTRPYQRYPRTQVPPPSIELEVAADATGAAAIVGPRLVLGTDDELLVHTINLFLELFGECEVLTEDLDSLVFTGVRRLNWTVLPQGEFPWAVQAQRLNPIISSQPAGNQPVILHHLEVLNSFQPDFTAVGNGGFSGYIVFGFTSLNLFVSESVRYGNATYVFGQTWAALSQMTKADILSANLQQDRLIHTDNWELRVNTLLG